MSQTRSRARACIDEMSIEYGEERSPLLTPLQIHMSTRAHGPEQRTAGIYIRVAVLATLYPENLLPAGEEKERHERKLLTRFVKSYIKCIISQCVLRYQKKKKKNPDSIELPSAFIVKRMMKRLKCICIEKFQVYIVPLFPNIRLII